ncbi:MAG: hypothetical protein GXY84_05170 [Clostridiales bacterium]|nr:hypothetical protein [Clostridiales bacterium]
MKRFCLLVLVICLCAPALAQEAPSPRQPGDADLASGRYDAYFDDAVFVGDSLTNQIHSQALASRRDGGGLLGQARFLHAHSYTLAQAAGVSANTRVQLKYRGQAVGLATGVARMGAGKVFVLLGHNDRAGTFLQRDLRNFGRVMDQVLAALPGVTFVALSLTPITRAFEEAGANSQAHVDAFNEGLRALAEEKGLYYVDVATPLKDQDGYLNPALTRDREVHLTEEGVGLVVEALRRFAWAQHEQGVWQMEEHHAQP